MFGVGMGAPLNSAFAASTMLIAIPTGIKIFNWVATMYGGRIRFATPMLFACAFLFQFLCAGLTGVILSVAPFNWQVTDSYFVVAHFHFVLVGSLIFTVFGAIYYWFPKVTGRLLSERLGPRHVYTSPADRGWDFWNLIASLGVPFQAAAVLVFLVNIALSLRRGERAGSD